MRSKRLISMDIEPWASNHESDEPSQYLWSQGLLLHTRRYQGKHLYDYSNVGMRKRKRRRLYSIVPYAHAYVIGFSTLFQKRRMKCTWIWWWSMFPRPCTVYPVIMPKSSNLFPCFSSNCTCTNCSVPWPILIHWASVIVISNLKTCWSALSPVYWNYVILEGKEKERGYGSKLLRYVCIVPKSW